MPASLSRCSLGDSDTELRRWSRGRQETEWVTCWIIRGLPFSFKFVERLNNRNIKSPKKDTIHYKIFSKMSLEIFFPTKYQIHIQQYFYWFMQDWYSYRIYSRVCYIFRSGTRLRTWTFYDLEFNRKADSLPNNYHKYNYHKLKVAVRLLFCSCKWAIISESKETFADKNILSWI